MNRIVLLFILAAVGCWQSDSEKFAEIRRQMESERPTSSVPHDEGDIDHTGPASDRSFSSGESSLEDPYNQGRSSLENSYERERERLGGKKKSEAAPVSESSDSKPSTKTDYDRGYEQGHSFGARMAKKHRNAGDSMAARESIMGVYKSHLKGCESTMVQMVKYKGEDSSETRYHTGRYQGVIEGFAEVMRE